MEGDERAGEGSKGNDRMEETKKKRREGKRVDLVRLFRGYRRPCL